MLLERFLSRRTSPGVSVASALSWFNPVASSGEEITPTSAMNLSAYYACLRNISEDVAKLTLRVNKRLAKGRKPMPAHPVSLLMGRAPNPEMTAMTFRETMTHWALSWGNGYAELERKASGQLQNLWPIHPDRVTIDRLENNKQVYKVHNNDGTEVEIRPENMFHLHGLGDGEAGYSVARVGCESIGRALAAQKFSGAIFAGGCQDRVAIKHPKTISPTAQQTTRRSWAQRYGGAGNAQPAFLDEGMDVVRFGIPPEEAQMLETMTFTVEDLARWLRCPLTKIQHFLRAQGWSTLEMLNIDYVTDTLLPWTIRWEQEIGRKLLTNNADLYARHSFDSLLRADSKTRGEFYALMRRNGFYTINDVLELEDRNPIGPEGDVRIVEQNMQPLAALTATDDKDTTTETDPAAEVLSLKREVVKAFIADGTLGDVVYNMVDAKKLLEDVNIPTAADASDPWVPVIAAQGRIISGETVKTQAGETVSGDVLASETGVDDGTDPLAGDGGQNEEPEPNDDLNGENESGSQTPPPPDFSAFRPLLADAIGRMLRIEVDRVKRARKRLLDKGDVEGFSQWVVEFYEGHSEHVRDAYLPVFEAIAESTDSFSSDPLLLAIGASARHVAVSKGDIDTLADGLQDRIAGESGFEVEHLAKVWNAN
jgi:HK97 family phage portal protein